MSLILEALRKSEAERRRGQAPDLLSDAVPVAPAPRAAVSRHWPWLLAGMAVVAGAALVLWWPREAATVDARVVAARAGAVPAAGARDAAGPSAPRRMPPPVDRGYDADPVATAPRTRAGTTTPVTPATPASPAATVVTAPAGKAPPPATRAWATAPPLPTPAEPAPRGADGVPSAVARAAPAEGPGLPPAPVRPPAASVATVAPAAAAFSSPALPLRLSELTGEERQQLPALKVSMHMWSPDAGNRFAIIDGNRVNEGDRVGEATIDAIQQDGVMLSWRGRQIRLPLR